MENELAQRYFFSKNQLRPKGFQFIHILETYENGVTMSDATQLKGGAGKGLVVPSGREISLGDNDFIVSKTDRQGKITYANKVFIRMSGYSERELLGRPHNVIRHPDMPRCVFRLLWKTIMEKRECFAYVVNLSKDGSHYWVAAHVTPEITKGELTGYISVRRKPKPGIVQSVIQPLYAKLLQAERTGNMEAGERLLNQILSEKGVSYDAFIQPTL